MTLLGVYHITGIEPEPWALGDLFVGKKGGKFFPRIAPADHLVAYQEALREEFVLQNGHAHLIEHDDLRLVLHFWRSLGDGRQYADATNLQKATEDALQGILYANDRQVRDVRSIIQEQAVGIRPHIAIEVYRYGNVPHPAIPSYSEVPRGSNIRNNDGDAF